jgi:hypothetical protein
VSTYGSVSFQIPRNKESVSTNHSVSSRRFTNSSATYSIRRKKQVRLFQGMTLTINNKIRIPFFSLGSEELSDDQSSSITTAKKEHPSHTIALNSSASFL